MTTFGTLNGRERDDNLRALDEVAFANGAWPGLFHGSADGAIGPGGTGTGLMKGCLVPVQVGEAELIRRSNVDLIQTLARRGLKLLEQLGSGLTGPYTRREGGRQGALAGVERSGIYQASTAVADVVRGATISMKAL